MIKTLESDIKLLDNKARFIKLVITEKIIIFKKSRKELINQIEKNGLSDHEQLLNIKTYQYTNESVEELLKTLVQKKNEIEKLKKISSKEMWKNDFVGYN